MAAELVGHIADRPALAAIAVTTDTSALTAIANDYGLRTFSVDRSLGWREQMTCFAISTSGQSASVLAACETARSLGCKVLGLSGRDGGALKEACDAIVVAPATETAHIQECHIVVIHLLCALIEKGLGLA